MFFLVSSKRGFSQMFSWETETVDSLGDVGEYASIDLDSQNYPHICYYDSTNFNLKYAKWDGLSWHIEIIESVINQGYFLSLSIDSNDFPHISYQQNGIIDGDLKYAKWNGSSWDIDFVDTDGNTGADSSLALDSNNYPHISYGNGTDHTLKYARWNATSWDIEIVDSFTTSNMLHSCIVVDSNNYPHISYRDPTNSDLKYAYWNGTTWIKQTVDSIGSVGIHSCIVLDTNDHPHISYGCTYSTGNLKYAVWNGVNWDVEIVDSEINTGRYSSLSLDNNNYPSISYNNMSNGNLKLACWDGSGWEIETVDSSGLMYSTSIVLDSTCNPHIAYHVRWNYYDLKYAKGTDIVPPSAVSNFRVFSGRLTGSINLTWNASGDNGNYGVIFNGQNRIEYSKDALADWGDSSNYSLQWATNTSPGNYETVTIEKLDVGETYYFWIKTADEGPNWSQVSVRESGIARLDSDFLLVRIYPRIFTPNDDGINDVVNFIFENPKDDKVCGKIFDIGGSLLRDNLYQNSVSSLIWDGKNNDGFYVKSGVYIYQIKAGDKLFNGTVVLAK